MFAGPARVLPHLPLGVPSFHLLPERHHWDRRLADLAGRCQSHAHVTEECLAWSADRGARTATMVGPDGKYMLTSSRSHLTLAKDCGRYVVIQMGSGMEERCHSVQGVHWCNKKNAHINTPSRCVYPSPSKRRRGFLRSGNLSGPPPVLKIFLRRPRTHKRHSLIYAHIPSTHTQPQRYTYDWHASHSYASHASRRSTRIPLARILHPSGTLLIPMVSISLARIPLAPIPLARIALARKVSDRHAKGCTQLQAALPAEELQA